MVTISLLQLIGALYRVLVPIIFVKMLFPTAPQVLLHHAVPLTPGAIPKGKIRLGKACHR